MKLPPACAARRLGVVAFPTLAVTRNSYLKPRIKSTTTMARSPAAMAIRLGIRRPTPTSRPTIGGGEANTASGFVSTVGGGSSNTAGGLFYSTVGGGRGQAASTVGGGEDNTASGFSSTIGGGELNTASGFVSTVGGGRIVLAAASPGPAGTGPRCGRVRILANPAPAVTPYRSPATLTATKVHSSAHGACAAALREPLCRRDSALRFLARARHSRRNAP